MLDYEIYSECDQINDLIEKRDLATARCKVINLLDRMQQDGNQYNPMVNHFIRVVGLFPYIEKKDSIMGRSSRGRGIQSRCWR